jgi:GT2 family glycosyltransferase
MIPTKDSPELLSRCLNGLYQNTRYPNFEVILADNNTTNKEALEVMRAYPAVRIEIPNPFNFSRANTTAARHAAGEYLVFLNNDTEIISELWLDHLLYYAEQQDVGAVGALLLHEDGGVQHAGVVLGMCGTADHMMRGFTVNSDGYGGNLSGPREVSAVTAACMAMRKLTFEAIGGFNEDFRNVYQDLDLCLRLRSRGLRIIWTPRALLIHHESHSRQKSDDLVDRQLLLDRWREVIEQGDPYYNPNLNVARGDYSWRT